MSAPKVGNERKSWHQLGNAPEPKLMMVNAPATFARFNLSPEKCIQGIDLIASRIPGVTQYYVGKVFFFADKEHLLDWGRPISGDRFVAMEHGPVPSFIYNLLKLDSGQPDEILDNLMCRVSIAQRRNKLCVHSLDKNDFSALSKSDIEYLECSIKTYGHMSFGDLKALSHQDPAYEAAWSLSGLNNEMDVSLWFEKPDEVVAQLSEKIHFSVARAIH